MRDQWYDDPTDEERRRIVAEAIEHVERQLALVRAREQRLEQFAEELDAKLRSLRKRRRELERA